MAQRAGKGCVIHLWIYRNARPEREIVLGEFPLKSIHGGLSGFWSVYFDELRAADLHLAEGISVRTGAAVRVRRGNKLTESVLFGRNPLHFTVEGSRYDISFIANMPFGPALFVSTKEDLAPAQAVIVFEHLQRTFTADIVLILRNDHWFLNWDEFPIYNPFFVQPSMVPTADEYSRTQSIVCHARKDGAGRTGCYILPGRG